MRGCREKGRRRREREREQEREIQRRKKRREKEGSARGGSAEELHTEELENALFRLHSHQLRWVCREREIPAK